MTFVSKCKCLPMLTMDSGEPQLTGVLNIDDCPIHSQEHIRKERDALRARVAELEKQKDNAMATVAAVREVITALYYGENEIHPNLGREQIAALSKADLDLRDRGFPSHEELMRWHTGRITTLEQQNARLVDMLKDGMTEDELKEYSDFIAQLKAEDRSGGA